MPTTITAGTPGFENLRTSLIFRAVFSEGTGSALAPPEFGTSVNPIPTRGGRLCPPHYCWHPRIQKSNDISEFFTDDRELPSLGIEEEESMTPEDAMTASMEDDEAGQQETFNDYG